MWFYCRGGLKFALYIIGAVLLAGFVANIQAWARAFASLFFSQSLHLKRTLKTNEGAPLTALGAEVSIMTDMVKVSRYFSLIFANQFSTHEGLRVKYVSRAQCFEPNRNLLPVLNR